MKCFRAELDSNIAAVITKSLIAGLDYIHSKYISHGDIKPENILIDIRQSDMFSVKLCDFGLCSHLGEHSSLVCRDFSGTSGKHGKYDFYHH